MRWETLLDDFGRRLLEELGESPYYLPTEYNPITRGLKDPQFVEKYQDLPGFSRAGLARVVAICQMVVYDATGGPDQDGKLCPMRRQWYQYWKGRFAQPLAEQMGDCTFDAQGIPSMNDDAWFQRLSQTYAYLVDRKGVTYKDLWVEDASRKMCSFWDTLFRGCNIVLCVEKNSLHKAFIPAAQALGAKSLYSGRGKPSKAATERMLREHFGWRNDYDPFSADSPLIVLSITDHDYDGERVISPTFAQQARRYTPHVLEVRVGIIPYQVTDIGLTWTEAWYVVKRTNRGYIDWANSHALFRADCECGNTWAVETAYGHYCPACNKSVELDASKNTPYGFEVESLRTRDYYGLIVTALLQVLPFDYIVERLRDGCTANAYDAATEVLGDVVARNPDYQALLAEFDRLEEIKREFENRVKDRLEDEGEPHIHDWRDDDENPTENEFRQHVANADEYARPWRPFRKSDRTAKLVKWLRKNAESAIDELAAEPIEW